MSSRALLARGLVQVATLLTVSAPALTATARGKKLEEPVTLSEDPPAAPAVEPRAAPQASNEQDAALGRREAARIAAGRVQASVSTSVDICSRRFAYSDPLGSLLAPYKLPVAPMVSFGFELYPFASTDVPVLRDLGLRGRVSRAFGLDSDTPQGAHIDTSWTRFGGELRERLLIPGSHPFELGIGVGFDASYFDMSTTSEIPALLPAARTVAARFGLDARLLLGWRLSLLLGGAYLLTTSAGEIYEQFRDPHVAGVDGDAGVAVTLIPGLEARLTGRYTRYFASFNPEPGDPVVAGGALDQQMQLGLGVRYAH